MAEVPTFFSGLVGGVVGAVAAIDVPAEGKLACCLRCGVEHLSRSLAEGRAPSPSCLMEKCDVDQSLDAGKQGAEYLMRGGRLVIEAILEGAKVVATRSLIAVEGTKEVVLRNLPSTQEKIGQAYSSFLRGYQGGRSISSGSYGGGYQAPSYHQQQPPQQQQPSYGAPPSSAQPSGGGFFW